MLTNQMSTCFLNFRWIHYNSTSQTICGKEYFCKYNKNEFLGENDMKDKFLFFNIFWCGPFLKSLFEFVTILLLFYVLVFWPQGTWILAPQPRIKPAPSAMQGEDLTPGSPEKSKAGPIFFLFFLNFYHDMQT